MPALSLQERSRFVRLLTDLSEASPSSADYNLAERLGHVVGVSGSMHLARGLRHEPTRTPPVSKTISKTMVGGMVGGDLDVVSELMATRERIMKLIIDSFSPLDGQSQNTDIQNTDLQNKLPSTAGGLRIEALKTFEPYRRFYVTHQIEMAMSIKTLRDSIRGKISAVASSLQQLAELDRTLEESLDTHTRKQFGLAPKLLELRFKPLIKQHLIENGDASTEHTEWLAIFCRDIRDLLLAELDVRLQPVIGLLEALNEHEETLHE